MTIENKYTQEERIWASLSHASIIVWQMGIIALIVYHTQKGKSSYVGRQAIQAIVYQAVGFGVFLLGWSCTTGFNLLTFITTITIDPFQFQDGLPPLFWVTGMSAICSFLLMGLWILYGLFAAIQTWMGKDFKYAIIGNMVEERLGKTAV